jgi:O-antigen chain-terminating methyltransferase
MEAVLSWVPDPKLRLDAEGADLNMASHVIDGITGEMLVFDGPRAKTCLGPDGDISLLPLPAPDVSFWKVQIGTVVEGRFWSSERGYPVLTLECERSADGSIVVLNPSTGQRHLVDNVGAIAFPVNTAFYGIGDSERCIEIPWVLSRFRGERRVLDLGHANAEARYIRVRNALRISFLVGLDPAATVQDGIISVKGDILHPPFRTDAFDLIIAISIVEHVGRDNSLYFDRTEPLRLSADLEAGAKLGSLLRAGGRLLVTVPFGREEDHGWFVQYGPQRIEAFVRATRCELTAEEYYGDGPSGWMGPTASNVLANSSYRTHHAGAVACLELTRS